MNELMAAAKLNGMETVYLVTSGMDGVNRFYENSASKDFGVCIQFFIIFLHSWAFA